jgi:hypothetical protein
VNPHTAEQLVLHRKTQEYTTADGTTAKPIAHRAGWGATFLGHLFISYCATLTDFSNPLPLIKNIPFFIMLVAVIEPRHRILLFTVVEAFVVNASDA